MSCVDGSKKSFKTILKAIYLATNSNDKILIVYSPSPDKKSFVPTL